MSKLAILKVMLLILVAALFSAFIASDLWRPSHTSLATDFNTTFWGSSTGFPPLELDMIYSGNSTIEGVPVDEYDAFFSSHEFCGSLVRIHSLVLKPPGDGLPAVLLLHGTNGSSLQLLDYGRRLASHGYVVMLMDSPGCGLSTGPNPTPQSIANLTDGPFSSYYYHNVLAAERAITVLGGLPYVNPDAIAVSGASMGGVTTYILGGIDDRVKATIPVLASGYFDELILDGSLANVILPPGLNLDDQAFLDLLRYFDCRAYASKLAMPTLILVGTHDEFFFIDAVNKTYTLIPSEKALNLAPNAGHALPDGGWMDSAVIWLDHYLKGLDEALPQLPLPSADPANFYTSVKISVPEGDAEGLSVFYRDGLPGSMWEQKDLSETDMIPMPFLPTTMSYYLAAKENGTVVSTSPVYRITVIPSAFVASVTFLVALGAVLFLNWREEALQAMKVDTMGSLLFLAGMAIWIVASFAMSLPWIDFGRASVSLLQLWDKYALHFPTFALLLAGIFASLFLYAARMWLGGVGMLLTFGWVYYFLTALTSLYENVSLGWGAYLLGACIAASFLIPAVLKILRG